MFSKDSIQRLEKFLTETQEKLSQSTGGQSVCSIHKHGSPSDYLKYNEGKEFIIRRVISLAKKGQDGEKISAFLTENEKKFYGFKNSKSMASSMWQSYADGGIEAIDFVRKMLIV